MSKNAIENRYKSYFKWMEQPRKGFGEFVVIAAIFAAVVERTPATYHTVAQMAPDYTPGFYVWLTSWALTVGVVLVLASAVWHVIGLVARRVFHFHMFSYWYNVDALIGGIPWIGLILVGFGAFLSGLSVAIG